MDERIHFIKYKGKQILLEDYSNVRKEDELVALIEQAMRIVQRQPPQSVLLLIDLTNAHFTPKISQVSKESAVSNTPYIKASALAGVTGLMDIVVKAVSAFSRRELATFQTREEALEWLIQQ